MFHVKHTLFLFFEFCPIYTQDKIKKHHVHCKNIQIAKGEHVDFLDENDMLVHVWANYRRS